MQLERVFIKGFVSLKKQTEHQNNLLTVPIFLLHHPFIHKK